MYYEGGRRKRLPAIFPSLFAGVDKYIFSIYPLVSPILVALRNHQEEAPFNNPTFFCYQRALMSLTYFVQYFEKSTEKDLEHSKVFFLDACEDAKYLLQKESDGNILLFVASVLLVHPSPLKPYLHG